MSNSCVHSDFVSSIPPRRLRVLIADDHTVIRDSLRRLFSAEPDLEVVAVAMDGREAVDLAHHLRPDVAVIDERMPNLSGVDATKQIIAMLPQIRVIGFSANEDPDWISAMIAAGASRCLIKGGPPEELLAAIRGPINASKG